MSMNPINLAFRFLLEIAVLVALGYWGWVSGEGFWRWVLAADLPILAGVLWGTFRVPEDPSSSGRAPIPVPGLIRLVLEIAILGLGALALFDAGIRWLGGLYAAGLILHYALSYDRIRWLLAR